MKISAQGEDKEPITKESKWCIILFWPFFFLRSSKPHLIKSKQNNLRISFSKYKLQT